MNLLVTGGAGFIGSNLIRQLIEETEIHRLVNLDCQTYARHLANLNEVSGHRKYHFARVDLRDRRDVAKVISQHDITDVIHRYRAQKSTRT
jgi:dTDP-glucose 4,6-dehydratase